MCIGVRGCTSGTCGLAVVLAGLWLLTQEIAMVHECWSLQLEPVTLRTKAEQVFKDAVLSATKIVNSKV
jgi:hypothetical protein